MTDCDQIEEHVGGKDDEGASAAVMEPTTLPTIRDDSNSEHVLPPHHGSQVEFLW